MIITRGVDRFIRNIVFIGTINRILGGAFGVVTACLALSLVFIRVGFRWTAAE